MGLNRSIQNRTMEYIHHADSIWPSHRIYAETCWNAHCVFHCAYGRYRHISTCELSSVACLSARVRTPQYGEKPNSAMANHVRVPLLVRTR